MNIEKDCVSEKERKKEILLRLILVSNVKVLTKMVKVKRDFNFI